MLLIAATLALLLVVGVVFAAAAVGFGSRTAAFRTISVPGDYSTIQAAINAAQPGDIVRVDSGTYLENLTLDKPITLISRTFDEVNPVNNTAILDGGAGGATIQIPPGMTQRPTIRGFVIRNGSQGVQASSEFIADFNYVRDSGNLVEYLSGAGGINRGNVFFGARDDAIHVAAADRPLLIENNRILYPADDAVEIDLQGAQAPAAVVDIDIWNNMIIGGREDGIQFIDHDTGPQDANRRFTIAGNLIANNARAGIGLMPDGKTAEDFSGADAMEPVRVYNNTFYGNAYGISGGDNLVAFNNIIVNSSTRGAWKVQGGPESNSIIAYTLFFNNGLDADQSTLGVGNILGQDPLFVAPPNAGADGTWETVDDDFGGLLLEAQSPAIDKGVTQFVSAAGEPIPANPISGYVGAAPDLGWREYGSPLFMTATPSTTPVPTLPVTGTPVSPTAVFTSTATSVPATATGTVGSPTSPAATSTPSSPTPGSTATGAPTGTANAQLTIQSLLPTGIAAGGTVDVTVSGSGFQAGATILLEGGQGTPPTVTNLVVTNSTTLVFTIQAASGTTGTSVWDVRVTNPDGNYAILADAFTVTP